MKFYKRLENIFLTCTCICMCTWNVQAPFPSSTIRPCIDFVIATVCKFSLKFEDGTNNGVGCTAAAMHNT